MTGAVVIRLHRRAKYGLVDTDRGDTMVFHLGMSGRWRVDPSEILPHDHLLLETGEGRTLALNDPRRFGFLDLLATDAIEAYPPFAALGPEPLGPAFTADYLAAAIAGRAAPIKAMLLNQRIVAGLGNIYVCEALNLAKIAPSRAAGRIAPVPAGDPGRRDSHCAGRGDRGGRINAARLCPTGRRTGLFLQAMARLWPGGRRVRLRHHGTSPGRAWPLDLLVPALPAWLTIRAGGAKGGGFEGAGAFRRPFSSTRDFQRTSWRTRRRRKSVSVATSVARK